MNFSCVILFVLAESPEHLSTSCCYDEFRLYSFCISHDSVWLVGVSGCKYQSE